MEGHPFRSLGQTGTCGSLAAAARQAFSRSLQQAHTQRHTGVTPMPSCGLPGPACHSQPRPAQLPSSPGSMAVVCSYMVSRHSAAGPPTARRSPAGRRQAWSLAACRRMCQPVAETTAPGHHPALGGVLPLTLTARAAHIISAHRSQGDLSSQDSDAVRLDACRLGHSTQSGSAQPLAQRTTAQDDS